MQITESSAPSKVTIKLDFGKPFEAHNIVDLAAADASRLDIAARCKPAPQPPMAVVTLQPRGDATHVTWAMHGPSPYISKLMGVFINMDRMIGKDFEAGPANLKTIAEK